MRCGTKNASPRLFRTGGRNMMRGRSPRPIRTMLNLADPNQVKSVRKRLGISASDLARIVDRMGNSLATIEREVELERAAARDERTRRANPNLFCNAEETLGGRIVSSKPDSFDCNTDTRQQDAFDIRAWFNDA